MLILINHNFKLFYMKKLLFGLFVFSFLFIGFQVNAIDEGCSSGVIFSLTTGARCPIVDIPITYINNNTGCSNNEVYSSTTGAKCLVVVSGDEDSHGCKGSTGYSWCGIKNKCLRTWEEKCEVVVPVEDKGCGAGQVYSLTTGQKCPIINIPVNPIVIKNFNSAFLLISPNPSDQRTMEYKNFLENLKPKFEQSFKEATYNSATVKVEDIFITNIGSENYLNNPSQLQQGVYSSIKELISKKGDKYDFINVFTNYDPKLSGNLSYTAKNNVKNIGLNIYDNTNQYGSSGKLIGITIQGDILLDFKKITSLGVLSDTGKSLFGIGNMLHEVGHFWGCAFGGLEVCNNSGHLYEGLESPAGTQDVLGTVPWLYNQSDNTYYQDHTGDYPLRYHPITLYSMGLLSKDQYGTKFNIFNVGTGDQIKDSGLKISKTVSVNDIIKSLGERSIENNIVVPINPVVPIDKTKDNGCSSGQVYSSTTGQVCPTIPIISTNSDNGCSGVSKYSSTTGQVCINYNGQNISSGNNYLPNTATPIRRTLKRGVKGDDVRKLQLFLNITADGSYGPKTQAKVMEWQATNGLTPDGAFGRYSRQKAGLE